MQLELFHGPVTTTEATLYAQVARPSESGDWKLQGTLLGPTNRRANTLPAKLTMQDAGPGESVLARVRVADPCGWSMDLPALYEVDLQLTHDGEVVHAWKATTGFRDFGAVGRSFSLNGERWVVRGAFLTAGAPLVVDKWRDERMICVCTAPTEDALRVASEQGVYLIVQLNGDSTAELAKEVHRVATWPAVLAVVLPEVPESPFDLGTQTNVAIGCFARDASVAKSGIDFVCVDSELLSGRTEEFGDLPVIAIRRGANGRTACDQLQSKLAPGNFAGYLVG